VSGGGRGARQLLLPKKQRACFGEKEPVLNEGDVVVRGIASSHWVGVGWLDFVVFSCSYKLNKRFNRIYVFMVLLSPKEEEDRVEGEVQGL